MIRLSRWQTFFIGFGIIIALFLGERLLFLHNAQELRITGGYLMQTDRKGIAKIEFMYEDAPYSFTSYGFSSLAQSNGIILIHPDNPGKAYINTAAEIWIPRAIGHLLALIVWYMAVSSFITNREHVRLSMKGISRENENKNSTAAPYNNKQLNRGK